MIRRATARVRDAAAAHTGIGFERVGGGELDLHLLDRQAEHFGDDLPEDHVSARAGVGEPDGQRHRSLGLETDVRVRESHADVAMGHRDAAADPRGLWLRPLARFQRSLERFFRSHMLEVVAVGQDVTITEKIPPPKLRRIEGERLRDHVHVRLLGEDHLRLAGRAGMTAGDVVRVDAEAFDQEVRDPVDPGAHARATEVHARRGLEGRVRAAVEKRRHVPGHEPSVVRHARAQRDDGWVTRVAGHQLLGVAHDHLHRPPGHAREVIGERQIHQRALAAEIAADGSQVDANPRGRKRERVRQQLLEAERHLVRRPHLDPIVLVDRHDARVGLEIAMVRELRPEGVLEDVVGLAEPGLHVSQLEPENRLDVRVGPLGRRAFIGPGILVHERGAGLERLDGIEDGREILVLDLDERERFFREVGVERRDHRNPLADESDAITGQERHVEHAPSDQNVRKIPGREHGQDAGEGLGFGRVDPENPRVRQRAPEGLPPNQPG